jgi:K+-transporting ATPase A subunit
MKVRVGPWESPVNIVTGVVVTVYSRSIDSKQQQTVSNEVCDFFILTNHIHLPLSLLNSIVLQVTVAL